MTLFLTDPKHLRGLFGFLHNEVPGAAPRPYVSNDWTLLKNKCLELGAHRIDGEEGTGRDLKDVISRIDSNDLAATIAALGAVDLRTHVELGYDEGIEVGERFAAIVVWNRRNQTMTAIAFLNESINAALDAGYSREYGYSDDFVDGIHRGILNKTETTEARVATLDDKLVEESDRFPGIPASELLAGGYDATRIDPASPIQALLEEVNDLITNLAVDYPATADECAAVRSFYAEEGDVDKVRELGQLLLDESDNPSDRISIAALDRFLLDGQERMTSEEWTDNGDELWIGGTDVVIGETSEGEVLTVKQLVETRASLSPDELGEHPALSPIVTVGERVISTRFEEWNGVVEQIVPSATSQHAGRWAYTVRTDEGMSGILYDDEFVIDSQANRIHEQLTEISKLLDSIKKELGA